MASLWECGQDREPLWSTMGSWGPSLAPVELDPLADPKTVAGVDSEFGLVRRGWDSITLVDFLARMWPVLCLPT